MDKTFREALEDAKEAVIEAWEAVKEVFRDVVETINAVEKQKVYRGHWYVPRNITMNHQVINRKPMHFRVRNHL